MRNVAALARRRAAHEQHDGKNEEDRNVLCARKDDEMATPRARTQVIAMHVEATFDQAVRLRASERLRSR